MFGLSALLGFARSTLGKIVLSIAFIAALFFGFQLWLANHDAAIRDAALKEFNAEQIEITRQAEQEFQLRLKQALEAQSTRIFELEQERAALQEEADELIDQINQGQFQGGEASEVLRETIRALEQRSRSN